MSEDELLVLDNNVFASFEAAGWFDAPSFWSSKYRIVTSESIWDEFTYNREIGSPPDWLSVESADLDTVSTPAVGQLGRQDWSAVALLEEAGGGRVVTNDKALLEVTEDRGHEAEWGTSFAIRTYERCGISVSEFEGGVEPYIEDLYLRPDVADELRSSEKLD
jgi:hypothetical protein